MPTDQEQQWITAWKLAAPKLQQIRDEELRQQSNKGCRVADGVVVYESQPHRNGLVTMQAWFTRFQLLNEHAADKTPLGKSDENEYFQSICQSRPRLAGHYRIFPTGGGN